MTKLISAAAALALLGGFCAPASALLAATHAQPDSDGNLGRAPKSEAVMRPPLTACLKVYPGGSSIFYFNVNLHPTATAIQITGGTVSGTICQAASWQVTGGSFSGNTLQLTASRSSGMMCATSFSLTGSTSGLFIWTGTATVDNGPASPQTTTLLHLWGPTCP